MVFASSRRVCLLAGGAWLASAAQARHDPSDRSRVRMPGPAWFISSERPFFQRELLELALAKAGGTWRVEVLSTQTWQRQVREMRDGHAEVAPLPALDAAYAEFNIRRVDFPLRRGLLGLRRFVVRTDRVVEFESVRDLADLQQRFRMGYGQDWVDRREMQRLGFQMATETGTSALYEALRSGKVDFLSRGLHEVRNEQGPFFGPQPSLTVLPKLAMFYPLDDCFYVAASRDDLHQAIERGLQRAWADGSYRRLFQRFFGSLLESLSGVSVLELKGYALPEGLSPKRFDVRSLIPTVPRT
ncbi:MAG: hypothetical protein ACOVN9_00925 [Inhella sp.]